MEHDEVPDRVIDPEPPTPGPAPILSSILRLVDGGMTVVDQP